MQNIALVIGIGSTGQLVLTYLKSQLLEANSGSMPSNVKLLSLDTTVQKLTDLNQPLIEGKEFIRIGNNLEPLVKEISASKRSHLQWFADKLFLDKFNSSATHMRGSGQVRQFGRLAFFQNIANHPNISSLLCLAMKELQSHVSKLKPLKISIVGSLSGEIGTGLILDIAHLARMEAQKLFSSNYLLYGWLVLPNNFTRSESSKDKVMKARAYASWQELYRFMEITKADKQQNRSFFEINQDSKTSSERQIFDNIYLIDTDKLKDQPIGNIPKEDFPFTNIAQAIFLSWD